MYSDHEACWTKSWALGSTQWGRNSSRPYEKNTSWATILERNAYNISISPEQRIDEIGMHMTCWYRVVDSTDDNSGERKYLNRSEVSETRNELHEIYTYDERYKNTFNRILD